MTAAEKHDTERQGFHRYFLSMLACAVELAHLGNEDDDVCQRISDDSINVETHLRIMLFYIAAGRAPKSSESLCGD